MLCFYRVSVDDLLYGNVDDGLAERHHVRVLVHVELLFGLRDVTGRLEELPAKHIREGRSDATAHFKSARPSSPLTKHLSTFNGAESGGSH